MPMRNDETTKSYKQIRHKVLFLFFSFVLSAINRVVVIFFPLCGHTRGSLMERGEGDKRKRPGSLCVVCRLPLILRNMPHIFSR